MDSNKLINAQGLAEYTAKVKEAIAAGSGSQQHLYWHTVTVYRTSSVTYDLGFTDYVIVLSELGTPLTLESFCSLVNSDPDATFVIVNGTFMQTMGGSVDYIPTVIYSAKDSDNGIKINYRRPSQGDTAYIYCSPTITNGVKVQDKVNQIF